MQGTTGQDHSSDGCFCAIDRYGSMSRRAVVFLVDVAVFLIVPICAGVIATLLGKGEKAAFVLTTAAALLWLYVYFVELERSRVGTIGLRLTKLEVVNLKGGQPGRVDMIARLGTVWIGAANLLVDWLWIPSDSNRQAIRDKFAGTYVIKKGSTPLGYGRVRYEPYFFLGMSWAFREVVRPQEGARPVAHGSP